MYRGKKRNFIIDIDDIIDIIDIKHQKTEEYKLFSCVNGIFTKITFILDI